MQPIHHQQQQQQQRSAAALAARPLARSMLVPRSSGPLSPGAIAGAVVGSVVGALLIAFCLFPFIVRARRRRLARHDEPGQAEMGQAPGGPIIAAQDLDDSSYKRSSASGLETANAHDESQDTAAPDHKPYSAVPQGVTVQQGLPSPAPSPTAPTPLLHGQPASSPTATAPPQSPVAASSKSRRGSEGTVGRDTSRELSRTDSYAPPSRELTGITAVGITEEPESFDRPSGSPEQGHFPHLKESLRSLVHRRRSSHQRRDSRRSTQGGTDGTRSPSLSTNNVLPAPEPTPSGLEIDVETPGLAWDYYHDPSLGSDLSDPYPQFSQFAPPLTSAGPLPSSQLPPSALFEAGQVPGTGVGAVIPLATRPIAEEPYALSPDTDDTVTPGNFSRQSTLLHGSTLPGSLLRSDTLPLPTIAAGPVPLLHQYNTGPSGNPMEMMKPTNSAENAWMLEQELLSIQNPPPAPVVDPAPSIPVLVQAPSTDVPDNDPKSNLLPSSQSFYQLPYQSPPPAPTDAELQVHEEPVVYFNDDAFAAAEYSTPPPSTGPSAENTPDTRPTPYTSSPSPPAEAGAESSFNAHLRVSPGLPTSLSPSSGIAPSPGVSTGLSPSPGLLLSPGLSSVSSPGRSPVPSPGVSPGPSPGRTPARPPGGFVCEVCGVVKSSYHQFNHHRRYHERPWPCQHPGCGRSFGTITHLKRHVNDKHFKTRKFYCTQPNCDYSRQGTKSFPRKDNWKRHMLNKHHIDPKDVTDEDFLGDLVMGES